MNRQTSVHSIRKVVYDKQHVPSDALCGKVQCSHRYAGTIDAPGQGGRWVSGDFRETGHRSRRPPPRQSRFGLGEALVSYRSLIHHHGYHRCSPCALRHSWPRPPLHLLATTLRIRSRSARLATRSARHRARQSRIQEGHLCGAGRFCCRSVDRASASGRKRQGHVGLGEGGGMADDGLRCHRPGRGRRATHGWWTGHSSG